MCVCNGAVEAAGETDRDGRANSLFPSNRIIRDKHVKVLHERQVSGGRKTPSFFLKISSNSTSDCVPLHCFFMPPKR